MRLTSHRNLKKRLKTNIKKIKKLFQIKQKIIITSKFVIDIDQCKCHLVLPKEKRDA